MRGINCRGLRLKLVAGLGIALWMPALSAIVANAQDVATTTTLTAGALSGCTQALTIAVTASGQPVSSGTVVIEDEFNGQQVQLASVSLSSAGTASPTVSLAAGSHTLTASFAANATYQASTSLPLDVSVTTECEYTAAVTNLTPATTPVNTLTPGQVGTAVVSITPSLEFTSTLTAPMFVSLSCSGLPDNATCTFTPQTVEILSTTTEPVTSTMVIQTVAASTTSSASLAKRQGKGSSPIAWAFLLPGALGLGGLAFGARRRRWLSRLSLVALVGLVTLLGTTACNPRYYYENHGPSPNPATPAGTYTVTVNAQSNNGVTAVARSTSFVLTVK